MLRRAAGAVCSRGRGTVRLLVVLRCPLPHSRGPAVMWGYKLRRIIAAALCLLVPAAEHMWRACAVNELAAGCAAPWSTGPGHGDTKPAQRPKASNGSVSGASRGPLLLVAVLSARSHASRRALMRKHLREQSRPGLGDSTFLGEVGGAVKVVFVVAAGCDVVREDRKAQTRCPDRRWGLLTAKHKQRLRDNDLLSPNDLLTPSESDASKRCGEPSCISDPHLSHVPHPRIALDAPNSTLASQIEEKALLTEARDHGDIMRIDGVVDEYVNSAHKMKAFIEQVGRVDAPPFTWLLKLDDDNLVDLGRILCELLLERKEAEHDASHPHEQETQGENAGWQENQYVERTEAVCRRIRLFKPDAPRPLRQSLLGEKAMRAEFWWSHFRQHPVNHRLPGEEYYVTPADASAYAATVRCIEPKGEHSSRCPSSPSSGFIASLVCTTVSNDDYSRRPRRRNHIGRCRRRHV